MSRLRRRGLLIGAMVTCLWSCGEVRVTRRGAAQQQVVSRNYAVELATMRAAIIGRFTRPNIAPGHFAGIHAVELKPPSYPEDWLAGWADPGAFLEPYRRIPGHLRAQDLLLEDATGDRYWQSEYESAEGPVRFRCGFIVHLEPRGPSATEVQVYEKTPEVWVGERWDLLHHGIGIGKVHDIRMVEPTVKDRVDLLDALAEIATSR